MSDLVRRPWGACWMVAEGGEGDNPLPFSLTAPKCGGWGGPFQPTPTPSPGLTRRLQKIEKGEGWFCAGGPGPKPWGPGPQALYSPMRGGVPSSLQHFSPQAFGDLANKPLSPASRQPSRVKNSKTAPVLTGS